MVFAQLLGDQPAANEIACDNGTAKRQGWCGTNAFDVAMTKAFVAVALMKLVEEKALAANEKAEGELKTLHSEVKKLQWLQLQLKTTKATTILEALKPEADRYLC